MESSPGLLRLVSAARLEKALLGLFAALLALAAGLVYQSSQSDLVSKRAAVEKELGESLALTNQGLRFLLSPQLIPALVRSGDRRRAEAVIRKFLDEGAELSIVVVSDARGKTFARVSAKGDRPDPAADKDGFSFAPAAQTALMRHRTPGAEIVAEADMDRILRRIGARHGYPLTARLASLEESDGKPKPALLSPIGARETLADMLERRAGFLVLILSALAVLYLLCLLLVRRMIYPFELLVGKLDAVIRGGEPAAGGDAALGWLRPFIVNVDRLIATVVSARERERKLMAVAAVQETASQVAHDIRSPLAALESLSRAASELPQDKRLLLKEAAARIRDIARDLAAKSRGDASIQLLPSLLEPLVAEKRMQFRDCAGLTFDFALDESCDGLFAAADPVELKRAVSNLIDNAVESLGERGTVRVRVAPAGPDRVAILIHDDGRGIDPEVLPKLGAKGETHGKAGGAGLGLYHARERAREWGGRLEIKSEVGRGTEVSLVLPRAAAPAQPS